MGITWHQSNAAGSGCITGKAQGAQLSGSLKPQEEAVVRGKQQVMEDQGWKS